MSINKIFGIGLPKTGTTSLGSALKILGFRLVPPWTRTNNQTFKELMNGQYRLTIMDQYDAMEDMPAPTFYREFDEVFPNSKFILTIRDKDPWIDSCKRQYEKRPHKMKHEPANLPKKEEGYYKMKMEEYLDFCTWGLTYFHRERFFRTYETHLQNVKNHFSERPQDLLILNLTAGEGWEKLCPFLEKPTKKQPFPHSNKWEDRMFKHRGHRLTYQTKSNL